MSKIIALFNHKGGVSKTTTSFNLGWMLAEKGKRVIIADTDPQCNLTGLVSEFSKNDNLKSLYETHPNQNIYSALLPAYESQPRAIDPVDCIQVNKRDGLFLLPGHVGLSEFEITLGMSQEISASIQALKNLPGAFKYLLDKTSEKMKADYVLIDMSPSLGAINQNLLMISNYFIVPAAPDYFSSMAIESISHILPRWLEWARKAYGSKVFQSAAYPFPEPTLKFLGTIIQKYRPRKGKASTGFQEWIDEISKVVVEQLFPIMKIAGSVLPEEKYNKFDLGKKSYCLSEIPDFNTLIATSQSHQVPVFALEDSMFGHAGTVLDQDRIKRDEFNSLFSDLADKIIYLTND